VDDSASPEPASTLINESPSEEIPVQEETKE